MNVAEHGLPVALPGIAITAAISRDDANDVALVDDHAGGERIAFALPGRSHDFDVVCRALRAASQAPGRNPRPGIADRHEVAVGAHPIVDLDPLAAAPAALATLLGIEHHAIDRKAVAGLRHFGGAVERFAVEAGEYGAVAVAAAHRAPAAELRLHDRVVPAGVGMRTADHSAADRGKAARRKQVWHMRREAAQHQIENAHLDLEIEADRRRLQRIEN